MNIITEVLFDDKLIMFAPEYYYDFGEYLYITCGLAEQRIYEYKDWGTYKENWYKRGNNFFCCYKKMPDGSWGLICDNVLDTSEFEDVMKLAVVKSSDRMCAWFSGLKNNRWDIYFAKIDLPDSQVSDNNYRIEKISLKPNFESEIHNYLPCVLYDGVYKMWYASRNNEHRRIFYAESKDGKCWEKNCKVLDIGEDLTGDNYAADCPNVVRYKDSYIMFYGGGSSRGIHWAISNDGLNWERKGLIIPRGSETDDSYNYSFYPAVAWNENSLKNSKELTIYFAGEDINNKWRILSVRDNFFDNMYESNLVSCKEVNYIIERLKIVPDKFFKNQDDCNCKDFYYENEEIVQLRPSTVPVFRFKKNGLVVKVMADRVRAENEYKARLMLHNRLDMVDVSIFYVQEKVLLVMPYVEQACSLNELFAKDAYLFKELYIQMLSECIDVFRTNSASDYINKIQWTGQTLELMNRWCNEIEKKYQGIELINGISGKCYNISEQIRKAKKLIHKRPDSCVLFSGDLNLRNVLCVDSKIKYIDFEYWGYYDLDYVVAKIISSLYKHCDCLKVMDYYINNDEICIRYSVDESVRQIFSLDLYRAAFEGINVNFERIKSYILCKLYFRFMVAYDNMQINSVADYKVESAIYELTRVLGVLDLFI